MRSLVAALAGLAIAAAPAGAVPVQELVGHSINWVEVQGFRIGQTQAEVVDSVADARAEYEANGWGADNVPGARSGKDGIKFYAGFARETRSLADRYGARGPLTWGQAEAARVVLHEVLHREGLDDYYEDDDRERVALGHPMSWWEEAVTEAVTLDLLPEYSREIFGARLRRGVVDELGSGVYAERMRIVRQMSRFATGTRGWDNPHARFWRAQLMRGSYTQRAAMIEDAYSVRVHWDRPWREKTIG